MPPSAGSSVEPMPVPPRSSSCSAGKVRASGSAHTPAVLRGVGTLVFCQGNCANIGEVRSRACRGLEFSASNDEASPPVDFHRYKPHDRTRDGTDEGFMIAVLLPVRLFSAAADGIRRPPKCKRDLTSFSQLLRNFGEASALITKEA